MRLAANCRVLRQSVLIGTAICLLSAGIATLLRAEETTEVKIDDIKLNVPKGWKQVPPASRLRLAQFEIPAVEGDPEAAELAIHFFGGASGGVKANVDRWVNQFRSEGRKTQTLQGQSAQGEYVIADVTGTYNKPIGPPIQQKTEPMPNARMLAIILAVPDKGNYFLKLTGPEKTVTAAAAALRQSIGGDAEKEKPWKSE